MDFVKTSSMLHICRSLGISHSDIGDCKFFIAVEVEVMPEFDALDHDDLLGEDLEGVHVVARLGGDGDGHIPFGVGDVFEGAGLVVDLGDLDLLGIGGGVVDAFESLGEGEGGDGGGVPGGDPEFLELLLGRVDGDLVAVHVPGEGLGVAYFGDLEAEVDGGVLLLTGVVLVAGDGAHGAEDDGGHGEDGVKVFHSGIVF